MMNSIYVLAVKRIALVSMLIALKISFLSLYVHHSAILQQDEDMLSPSPSISSRNTIVRDDPQQQLSRSAVAGARNNRAQEPRKARVLLGIFAMDTKNSRR